VDEPGAVAAVDEAGHGLAELFQSVIQLDPQALVLEGADPALSAAVGLRLTQERRAVGDPQPGQRAGEVGRAIWRPPIVAEFQTTSDDVRAELAQRQLVVRGGGVTDSVRLVERIRNGELLSHEFGTCLP
jgi:hypothetical protein